ncbi:unnamed protein product [Darwinula stevensoni]|uniref:Solute carrier organic anion transporter family member n=1 Tax=Darwinula stevensoni TaxID=69355 RepID=A0A7R8X4C0_9CRUS|nr:unnamed protein product [Darwinula stevensoni]CAG0883537.1 unnamed protein product [Darwinula stevensoni]
MANDMPSVYAVTGLYASAPFSDDVSRDGDTGPCGSSTCELLGLQKEEKTHKRESSRDWNPSHKRETSRDWNPIHKRETSRDWNLGHKRESSRDWKKGHERHGSNVSKKSLVVISSHLIRGESTTLRSDTNEPPECGLSSFRPRFLQGFATIKVSFSKDNPMLLKILVMFVLLLSLIMTLQQAVSSGYLNSVITTIEKRFEIPSSLSGVIASTYEIGNLITIIFVSYLGSHRHIPVWIGRGVIVMGIGSMVFVLPYFMSDPYSGASGQNLTDQNICRLPVGPKDEFDRGLGRLSPGLSSPPLNPGNSIPGQRENCIEGGGSNSLVVVLFVLAQLLLGCGGSPIVTLGTTYVDDHVKKENSAFYIGCMFSLGAFGPVCGFLLGAYLLSFHEDALSSNEQIMDLDQSSPQWIGMWWGGFMVCGILLVLGGVPLFFFPKSLTREKERVRLEEKAKEFMVQHKSHSLPKEGGLSKAPSQSKEQYGRDVKNIPASMWKLLSNPVYLITCLGTCLELVIVSGFLVFLPKYLETQFYLTKSQASVFTGGIAVPGACFGIFFGGYLLKRFQLRPRGALALVLAFNTVCLAFYSVIFFIGCDNLQMAGTTTPYSNSTPVEGFQVNLTSSCNFGCECSTMEVEPVCGYNGITYFSPCYAGCTAPSAPHNYTNCACIVGNAPGLNGSAVSSGKDGFAEVRAVPVATAGACASACEAILPFLLLLLVMTFLVAVTQMPLLMIILRSVEEEERSFALGLQFVMFRLLGYVPSPIVFGNVIDTTCLLWKEGKCGGKSGRCLLYDIEAFRFKYIGICAGIKVASMLVFLCDWLLVRRQYKLDMGGSMTVGEIVNSIVSLDKGLEEMAEDGAKELGCMHGQASFLSLKNSEEEEEESLSLHDQTQAESSV